MATLVVCEQHRNQCYSRVKSDGRFGTSPSSRQFREINRRSCHSGAGTLSSPSKFVDTPVTKWNSLIKTPSPTVKSQGGSVDGDITFPRGVVRSYPVHLSIEIPKKEAILDGVSVLSLSENVSFNERWAGPGYSNSPPPSSLPIPNFPPSSLPMPKFQMRPKRSGSVELAGIDSSVELKPLVKSAPASPVREYSKSISDLDLFFSADSATETLRRILNLDAADE